MERQLGSSLLDIQKKTNVDFAEAYTYISVLSFGSIVGCIVASILYGRVAATCYLGCLCGGLAITEAALPWCDSDVKAYIVHFIMGYCNGSINSCKYIYIYTVTGIFAQSRRHTIK